MGLTKSVLFVTLLVTIIAASQVEADQGVTGTEDRYRGIIETITNITGTVLCLSPHNHTVGHVNGSALPFPHAVVELRCENITIASSITDLDGLFNILVNPVQAILSTILSSCSLKVATPLSACNPNVSPSVGNLVSDLQFIGHIIQGLLNMAIVIPVGFVLTIGI